MRPVVVVADSRQRGGPGGPLDGRAGRLSLGGFPLPQNSAAVHAQRPGERLDRGEQPLLETADEQTRSSLGALGFAAAVALRAAGGTRRAASTAQFGRIIGKAVDVLLDELRLGNPPCDFADVLLEPADHDLVKQFWCDRHAAAEPLRIEDLQQRREALEWPLCGVAERKRRCSNAAGEVADGAGDLRVDGVLLAARRGGVMSLVKDKQRARRKSPELVRKRAGVGLVDQQAVGDEEPRMGRPGVDAVAALSADPADVFPVEDFEG